MEILLKLRESLNNQHKKGEHIRYQIPGVWNYFQHGNMQPNTTFMNVNPYLFYRDAIDYIMKHKVETTKDIKKAYMYSMMIRASGSFDHDNSGSLEDENAFGFKETGTFIKMIAYLPTLQSLGINTLYLLPIMKTSKYEKKGEMGSVYGVTDFFELDPDLFDPIVGEDFDINDQFKAFVEAAHTIGMNVILDIIPRTNSVNTSFVIDHPEWFYWIKTSDLNKYHSPTVPGVGTTVPIDKKNIDKVYASKDVQEHIAMFQYAPSIQYPTEWESFVKAYKQNPVEEILPLIEKTFHLRIAPAFSDVINDTQPPWSDVTFFRMYLDSPRIVKENNYVDTDIPYILFDTIKSNLFPGACENRVLWDTIGDILPHFIKRFDIDGARIDMGHALPEELSHEIIQKARKLKPNFHFIAEILNTNNTNATKAKKMGYDLIIGDGFYHTHRFEEEKTRDFYYNAASLPINLFALGETHDNPRLISRKGGYQTLRFVSILNLFSYNCIPFLNSGQELLEEQPMNLGVDCPPKSDEVLATSDPYYKKLALFDRYQFHYEKDCFSFFETLRLGNEIRKFYLGAILNQDAVTYLYYPDKTKIAFIYQTSHSKLYVLANASLHATHAFDLSIAFYNTLYSTKDTTLTIEPLGIRIIEERI